MLRPEEVLSSSSAQLRAVVLRSRADRPLAYRSASYVHAPTWRHPDSRIREGPPLRARVGEGSSAIGPRSCPVARTRRDARADSASFSPMTAMYGWRIRRALRIFAPSLSAPKIASTTREPAAAQIRPATSFAYVESAFR